MEGWGCDGSRVGSYRGSLLKEREGDIVGVYIIYCFILDLLFLLFLLLGAVLFGKVMIYCLNLINCIFSLVLLLEHYYLAKY